MIGLGSCDDFEGLSSDQKTSPPDIFIEFLPRFLYLSLTVPIRTLCCALSLLPQDIPECGMQVNTWFS